MIVFLSSLAHNIFVPRQLNRIQNRGCSYLNFGEILFLRYEFYVANEQVPPLVSW